MFSVNFADSLVIGAGPVIILTIIACLEYFSSSHTITWIDSLFTGGYLSMLEKVPRYGGVSRSSYHSNTKCKYIKQSLIHFDIIGRLISKQTSKLRQLLDDMREDNEFYHLGRYRELFLELQNELLNGFSSQLTKRSGLVSALERHTTTGFWTVKMDRECDIFCRNVFITNGSHPKLDIDQGFVPPCPRVSLEVALNEDPKLNELVTPSDTMIAVDSSHSAALSLRNLYSLSNKPSRIIHIRKRPLLLAIDVTRKGISINNNLGLKGRTAKWVLALYDTASLDSPVEIGDHDEAVVCDAAFFERNGITVYRCHGILAEHTSKDVL